MNFQKEKLSEASNLLKECRNQCTEYGFLYEKDCADLCTAQKMRLDAWSDPSIVNKVISEWQNSLALPECKETCTAWSPDFCRGGYQERTCSNVCPTQSKEPNKRICETSQNGYLNLNVRGSYLHEDSRTGSRTIFTSGEYLANPTYIGETDGKLYLVDGNGNHIQGVGLHVGESAILHVNAPVRPDIIRFGNVPQGGYAALINGINADIKKTNNGFNIEFKIPANTEQKEFTLTLLRNGKVTEVLPLVADIQPSTSDILNNKPVIIDYDDDKETWFVLVALFSIMIVLAFFVGIAGLIIYLFLRKKK